MIGYESNVIFGKFRTAGCLAIMIAFLMGANPIYVVGMDGYTLHNQADLMNKNAHHHMYGEGYTDDADWRKCLSKDQSVQECLDKLRAFGVKFSIVTQTKFTNHYNGDIL